MTISTSDDPFPPQHSVEPQEQPPPFDDMISLELTRPVELAQLQAEIAKAVHQNIQVAQTGPQEMAPISEDNPAGLAVSPGSVDRATVQKVIDEHTPQEGYGIPEEYRKFLELLDRIGYDPEMELTDDELKTAVRGLLIRAVQPMP